MGEGQMTLEQVERCELLMCEDIRKFILAGKATFTLQSKRTGTHYTYKILKAGKLLDPVWFVRVLTGPDSFTYLGLMDRALNLHRTAKSQFGEHAPCHIAISWFLSKLQRNIKSPEVSFFHEGKCGRCGRTLTHPESIRNGIGPECAGKL
jgi:hypothetical protein